MKKILVIEDESSLREVLLDLLNAEHFEVFGAGDGKAGVELAKAHLPDLIICDVMMPELNGFGVLASLRSCPDTATIPFIFLTAKADKTDLREGMSLGADDYLTKPFTCKDLLKAISVRVEKQAAIEQQQAQKIEQLRSSIALSLPLELRSPLNNILGFSKLLIDESDSLERQEIREMSQTIHKSAERLYRLTQNFLLYAELELLATNPKRIESLRSSRVSSAVSIIEPMAMLMSKRAGREADLQLELQDSSVQIAKGKLEKIVEELLDNAFKYSPAGTKVRLVGAPFKLDVLQPSQNGYSYSFKEGLTNREAFSFSSPLESANAKQPQCFYGLSVTDYGRGMTADQIAEVGAYRQFERKLYEQQGSGLGLSVTKRLAELLGGELIIESKLGQHTTVKVVLPI